VSLSLAPMTAAVAESLDAWVATPGVLPSAPRLLDGDHLVVLDDGAPIGLVCVGTAARPDGVAPAEDGATDVWLAVAPEHRGDGRATRAVDLVVETLRLGGHTMLRVSLADDEPARRLAVRCGFVPRGPVDADDGVARLGYVREVLA
jgi:GNAT superfamily N-acetyltransferase